MSKYVAICLYLSHAFVRLAAQQVRLACLQVHVIVQIQLKLLINFVTEISPIHGYYYDQF